MLKPLFGKKKKNVTPVKNIREGMTGILEKKDHKMAVLSDEEIAKAIRSALDK